MTSELIKLICAVRDGVRPLTTGISKTDMAEDLAAVLDRLGVGAVRLVVHDWGGPVAIIMMLRHPEKVSGFSG